MKTFLQQLYESGQVTVPFSGQPFDSASDAAAEIAAFDRAARLEFPGEAPVLAPEVAEWAAVRFAEICRLLVARDLGEEEITKVLAVKCPGTPSAETDYTADLFFRRLPALADFVERLSPGDPLVRHLGKFAEEWPLSTPGMKISVSPERVGSFVAHHGVLRLYADRIIAAEDLTRLGQRPEVDAALREAIGGHPELCPKLAEALAKPGMS
jgi:hypothetical protein